MVEIIDSLEGARERLIRSVVTIGNFDGMHIGHQAIFAEALAEARARDATTVALTFDPHPMAYFRPDGAPLRLAPIPYKYDLMGSYGVDVIVALPFDAELAGQSPEEFVAHVLVEGLGANHVVVGEDFRFGRKRAGDVESLEKLGAPLGMTARGAERIKWEGEVISSSRIREAVRAGELESVREMLGRPYRLYGTIAHGDARGREMGYPTANLVAEQMAIPPDGIYITGLARRGEEAWEAATSIGVRPTFGGGERTIETFVLDERAAGGLDLYGDEIELEFLEYIREERKFDSAEALIAQMDDDVARAEAYFRKEKEDGSR